MTSGPVAGPPVDGSSASGSARRGPPGRVRAVLVALALVLAAGSAVLVYVAVTEYDGLWGVRGTPGKLTITSCGPRSTTHASSYCTGTFRPDGGGPAVPRVGVTLGDPPGAGAVLRGRWDGAEFRRPGSFAAYLFLALAGWLLAAAAGVLGVALSGLASPRVDKALRFALLALLLGAVPLALMAWLLDIALR